MELRFNQVPRDQRFWFAVSRVRCISTFFSIHFKKAGLENIVRYAEEFVKSSFHCSIICKKKLVE